VGGEGIEAIAAEGSAVLLVMLTYTEFARAEEARQAKGLSEIADVARPFAGGTAGRSSPGGWSNTSVGMGLNGPVSQGEVDEVVAWYEEAGIEPRFEVCPFADGSLVAALETHGCVPLVFENTFFRALSRDQLVTPLVEVPRGLKIERVDPSDAAAVRRYSAVAMSGFVPEGTTPPEEDFEVSARVVRHSRTIAFLATIDGEPAGAGAGEVSEALGALGAMEALGGAIRGGRVGGVVAMFGASVLPKFRNRGVQQALIAARLNHGIEHGATMASIGAKPGIATERNARRMGFELAYTKVHVVKPGPGLVRNRG
jgi:GNAT superfamily N-acetyltransferase